MLRGGIWHNHSRSLACTAWHRALRLRQARRYSNGPGPDNAVPQPVKPGFGGRGGWGAKAVAGASPLLKKTDIAATLTPQERAAVEAAAREKAAREAAAKEAAEREAAERAAREERVARIAAERTAREAAAKEQAARGEVARRNPPIPEPGRQDNGFIRKIVPKRDNGPVGRVPFSPDQAQNEEWGHMRRRQRDIPRRDLPDNQQQYGHRRLDFQTTGRKTPDEVWSRFESSFNSAFKSGEHQRPAQDQYNRPQQPSQNRYDRPQQPAQNQYLRPQQSRNNTNERWQQQEQPPPENPNLRRHQEETREQPISHREPPPEPPRRSYQPDRPKKQHAKSSRSSSYRQDDDFDDQEYAARRARRLEKERRKRERELELLNAGPVPILLPEYISVSNLADALGVKLPLFLSQLSELGFESISAENIMTGETAALVAQEYGFEPTVDSGDAVDLKPRPAPEDPSALPPRPPVVTIMGHVDHGKTTLLDYLRKSSVAASEHGGITQHIGAFSVRLSGGKQITFLDTPGHAAFLSMRQRGANVTDIVILVVAADDSVKPQTVEALRHARAAKVPIIVAINKVDKEEARVDLVKSDLANNGVEIEDFGGDVQTVCVSGKTGQGMADLEESILSLSEILDLRAEPDGMAEGWVLESSVKSVGRAATVLVKRGTLRKGDYIVAGKVFARIRVLRSEAGLEVEEAPPGTPVEILGWRDLPDAGDEVLQAPDEDRARRAVDYRRELSERGQAVAQMAQQDLDKKEKAAADAAAAAAEEGEDAADDKESTGTTTVNFLVRGDVHGSVEAVCASIMEIGNNEVRPRILKSGPGQITESDIEHASLTGSSIVTFNNPVLGHVKKLAEDSGVKILDYNIIYHLVDAIKDMLSEHLKPRLSTRVLGEAEVLQLFPINLRGRVYKTVAGCRVRNGQLTRNGKYRVLRKGVKVFEGVLDSMKQGKKDVSEMKKGAECGMSFEGWDDLQAGDQIQAFEEISEKRHL